MSAILGSSWLIFIWTEVWKFLILWTTSVTEMSEFLILWATSVWYSSGLRYQNFWYFVYSTFARLAIFWSLFFIAFHLLNIFLLFRRRTFLSAFFACFLWNIFVVRNFWQITLFLLKKAYFGKCKDSLERVIYNLCKLIGSFINRKTGSYKSQV